MQILPKFISIHYADYSKVHFDSLGRFFESSFRFVMQILRKFISIRYADYSKVHFNSSCTNYPQRKTYPSATLQIINPRHSGLGVKAGLRVETTATRRLNQDAAYTHTQSYHIFVLLCPKHATDLQTTCKLTERKTNSENSCCCADGPLRVTTLCITTLFHFFSSPNHSRQSNLTSHGHLRDGQYKNQKSWSGRLRSFVTFARSHFEKRDRMT